MGRRGHGRKGEPPCRKHDLELVGTIELNGRVEYIAHEGRDHRAGPVERKGGEFPFSSEMEKRIGRHGRAASVRMAFGDGPIDPHAVDEAVIRSYCGVVERRFSVSVSDLSGHLRTDE